MKCSQILCKHIYILAIIFNIKIAIGCETQNIVDPNVPTLLTKNGFLTVTIKGSITQISITKSCGSYYEFCTYVAHSRLSFTDGKHGIICRPIIYESPVHNLFRTKINGKLIKSEIIDCGDSRICLSDGNGLNHTVIETDVNSEIIKVSREIPVTSGELYDCFELPEDVQYVGGPQWRYQHWPIQHMYFDEEPYLPTHPQNMALAERYWLSSKGIYIYSSEKDPLFLDQNNYKDKSLCLISKNKKPYRSREKITLNYEIGVFKNPRLAHEYVVQHHFGKPTGHPDEKMIQYPIWSTWARYKMNINDTLVMKFADEIIEKGYKNSQLEIDDNWETCYGSAVFDNEKFTNIAELTDNLKEKGFRVTLWIHPFINEDCTEAYTEASENDYFVTNIEGDVHTTWWQGETGAGAIDFTNPKAVAWWVARLKNLQNLGIDSFKFDAGETSWLPQVASLTGSLDLQPGIFTTSYVSALASNFDTVIEARVGLHTQKLPIFIRMIDKDSNWGWNNGIPTLITTLLQMNLNGYPYVLPDMIGGNGYAENPLSASTLPSKELFIRWLQANVFMPSIQYSFVPWDYDNETDVICKKFTELHAEITPKIINLMKKTVETGAPVNPPIWWVDPLNVEAHKINDEFMLGEEYLIAPVIEEGAITRDIYLPSGKWKDANNDAVHTGPIWLKDYQAPLDVLPYFIRTT